MCVPVKELSGLQIDLAQAADVDLPVVTGTDGRPLLQYSRLLPRGGPVPLSKEEADDQESRILSEANSKLRAERLKASLTAASSAAATAAAEAGDSDEEGFMHAAAVGKLPEHLIRSESQESDSDIIMDRHDDTQQQPVDSDSRVQQDPKRLQAFARYSQLTYDVL